MLLKLQSLETKIIVLISEVFVPYSGKLSREKTFVNNMIFAEKFHWLLAFAAPKNTTPQISRRKLLITTKLRNLWNFSSSKVSHYMVIQKENNMWQSRAEFNWLYYHIRNAVTQYFGYGWGSCKLLNTWHIYTACMNPTLNCSVLQYFEHSNAIEIRNRIMFNFYPGHYMYLYLSYV